MTYTKPEVSENVRGLSKLVEELGELQQLLGKFNIFPSGQHPDGKGDLRDRLEDEMADVMAALTFFREVNNLRISSDRVLRKHKLFSEWF